LAVGTMSPGGGFYSFFVALLTAYKRGKCYGNSVSPSVCMSVKTVRYNSFFFSKKPAVLWSLW